MAHELTFQQIKDQVEFPELLLHYGYTLKKGETLHKGKWHVFEGDDTLVVFKGKGGDWMYFNSQDDRDKGSVIDWMKNRVGSGRIAGIEQLPGQNLWQSVNQYFRAFLNLPADQRPRVELAPITPTEPGERFQSLFTQQCGKLTETSFLESRGISQETLRNPQFAGRIYSHYHTVQKGDLPPKTYVNVAFPAFHEERVVGLELKGEGFKGQAPDSEFARSLWLSNLPQGRQATHLVVSESGLDTLSYAQLHPSDRALYASTSGLLTQNKIFEMKRLVGKHHLTGVRATFDNDTQGHHFDTRLLAGFAGEQNPMKVIREHKHLLTVEITTTNQQSIQNLTEQLKRYNAQTSQQYYQASGPDPRADVSSTLNSELIATTRPSLNTYQFHLPMNREALGAFNQAAVQHLHFEQKIELVKSQGKDWNEDLKTAQMRAVVQRELGPVEEHQPQQALAQADGKERTLIVAFREGRHEAAQLATLQVKLENAGLTIDHRVSLPPSDPHQVATELHLRYQTDSPQLDTISQALDGLSSNPKAEVREDPTDAATRRQLAEALAQQRQVGPPLVPSESPAHDQARQVFLDAAKPVIKELQAANQHLQAGRLQDISKYLVQQPQLRATDVENMNKVFAAVDRLDPLKNSPAVGQLRQAVQVLEKPAAKQSQEQEAKPEPPKPKRGPKL